MYLMMELTENGIFTGKGIISSPICDSIMDFVFLTSGIFRNPFTLSTSVY
jgi:pyridoxal biosynthesis lyase PdxS